MDNQPTTEEIKANVKDTNVWIRLLFMLLFAFLYSVAEFVLIAVVVYQFLHVLITGGDKDEKITGLGFQLSAYIYQILQFQTFNSEQKPFPMANWPEAKLLASEADKPKPKRTTRKRSSTRKTTTTKKPIARKPRTTKKEASKTEETKQTDSDKPNEDDNTTPV